MTDGFRRALRWNVKIYLPTVWAQSVLYNLIVSLFSCFYGKIPNGWQKGIRTKRREIYDTRKLARIQRRYMAG